jgi:hypothetical protein
MKTPIACLACVALLAACHQQEPAPPAKTAEKQPANADAKESAKPPAQPDPAAEKMPSKVEGY